MPDFERLTVRHRSVRIRGLDIFYREAGPRDAPALLLLHGFPTSSHMFRHLIPSLADRYRLVAPDYPGFGRSSLPDRDKFTFSFAALTDIVAEFTDAVGLDRHAIYIQDFGAPIGLRLALKRPNQVTAIISQNGNAYDDGLGPDWDEMRDLWSNPTPEKRAAIGPISEARIKRNYTGGVPEEQLERLSPDNWTIDWTSLSRPGNGEAMLDLLTDYGTNVALYPAFHSFFRERRPPALIIWGKRDPVFAVAGAKAYMRDLPHAELRLMDGSHFLLETHGPEASWHIRRFLDRTKLA
ncbi:alpha/beta hydrolase [Sphingomonas sp.]|uniref:alpha/beta fold hydrolase n=1 Tax=Sphingomonas sp. TaxID=28214 RepID=UPI0025F80DA1|nr:alpha/beta hydrolase [Sphingomonas sp.]